MNNENQYIALARHAIGLDRKSLIKGTENCFTDHIEITMTQVLKIAKIGN